MKKILLLIPSTLLPYFLLTVLACLFANVLPTNILDTPSGFVMIAVIILYGFVSFVLNVIFALLCLLKRWDGKQIAKINMIVKLAQIPAYLVIFVLGLILFITIFTFMFAVFFVFFDCFCIFLSGLTGACTAIRCYADQKKNFKQWLILGVLQFVFVADVVSCIILYVKAKRTLAVAG